MKNAGFFILKAIFVLKIFKFLSWPIRSCSKTVEKAKVIFKIYDVMNLGGYNYTTNTALYSRSQGK